jgi:16S rRNA processing protein RimM
MIEKKDLFNIGQFIKPHGVKGEINLVTYCEIPDLDDDSYIVCEMDGILVPFYLESCRPKGSNSVLVKFENIDSATQAKIFMRRAAYLPLDMISTSSDEFSNQDQQIIGFAVFDENLSERGVVTDFDDTTANVLIKTDFAGKEIIIPTALIKSLDLENRIIEVSLPEGFMEI